jgi:hypothetical protein
MRNKWVDLMTRRGALACAELTYMRNNSPSNFRAMRRARVAYEAAVEAIGKDVVTKSREEKMPPFGALNLSGSLLPPKESYRRLETLLAITTGHSRQKSLNRVGDRSVYRIVCD